MGLLKPRTATKLVFHGDDMESLQEARQAVVRAEAAMVLAEDRAEKAARGPRRGGDEIVSAEAEREALAVAQAAYNERVDEAAGRAVEVRLQALGSHRFRVLLAAHAARLDDEHKVVEADAEYGVNVETFPRALLLESIVEPEVSQDDLGEFLDDELSDGDFEELWVTAYWLNKAQGVDPRLGKFSAPTLMSNAS